MKANATSCMHKGLTVLLRRVKEGRAKGIAWRPFHGSETG